MTETLSLDTVKSDSYHSGIVYFDEIQCTSDEFLVEVMTKNARPAARHVAQGARHLLTGDLSEAFRLWQLPENVVELFLDVGRPLSFHVVFEALRDAFATADFTGPDLWETSLAAATVLARKLPAQS